MATSDSKNRVRPAGLEEHVQLGIFRLLVLRTYAEGFANATFGANVPKV